MIPIQLKFKGLYSYREEQTIDFQKLTSSQLFGIFGPIGCGKSSILEAIVFALYDQSDRLKTSGDNRYYNMLNLQSDEMVIDFEFCLDQSRAEHYRTYFRAGRNRNHYEQVSVRDRILYRRENEGWLPLEDKDASGILGLSYSNFMQTVIIPQGKFREFVDQGVTQRTKMLKELYPLEKFELSGKVGYLLKNTQLDIRNTEGQMLEIGAVSEEEIEQGRQEVKAWKEALANNQAQCQEAEEACRYQENLRKLFDNIRLTREELGQQEQQHGQYLQREQRLKDYNRAVTYFNEKLNVLESTRKEISGLRKNIDQQQATIKQQEAQRQETQASVKKHKTIYEQREEKAQQCDDLENAIAVRKYKAALQTQKDKLKEAEEQLVSCQKQKKDLQNKIAEQEDQLSNNEKKLKRQPELQQLDHWHETRASLLQQQTDDQNQEKSYATKLLKIKEEKDKLLQPYPWASQNGSFEKCRSLLKQQMQSCKDQIEQISEQMRELQISEKIASFAESLQEGNACPLCGATHHPQVAHHASVAQQLAKQREALQKHKDQESRLETLGEKIVDLEKDHDGCVQLQQQLALQQKQCAEKLSKHQEQFCWTDFETFDAKQIKGFLQTLKTLSTETDRAREDLKASRQKLQVLDEKLQKVQNTLSQAHLAEGELLSSINAHMGLMKSLHYEKLERHDLAQLEENLKKGRKQIKTAETAYEEAREKLHQLDMQLGASRSRMQADTERVDALEKKADELDQKIKELCFEKDFSGLEEVKSLFLLELDPEAEQEAINLYKTRVSSLQDQLDKLLKEAKDKEYEKHKHEELLGTLAQLKKEVQNCQESCALSQKHVEELLNRQRKGKTLQQKLDALQSREGNLKELRKLFQGSGFVKYASAVYLENLCRTANERFMKLSRNNLSLELNEDNEFIVRDYLNNGRTRLLKTLSGGQTFQASLCLALALAENVKSLNQADQSFFFLDEGFGALDRASLRVVFDTLKSLRQEKRIVGIISHVEELQQEIDISLQIENDKERGSLIKCSWEA